MGEFHKLLIYQNPGLAEKPSSDKPSPVDAVKAAVCQNINLLVNRDEEEFSKFLQTFVTDVWGQLINVSTAASQVSCPKSAPPNSKFAPLLTCTSPASGCVLQQGIFRG
jgi:hypothetical protein